MTTRTIAACLLAIAVTASVAGQGSGRRIVQSGFDAFSQGTFGNGGENLYVSATA